MVAAAVRQKSETAATSGTSVDGERAGVLSVRWGTSTGVRIKLRRGRLLEGRRAQGRPREPQEGPIAVG